VTNSPEAKIAEGYEIGDGPIGDGWLLRLAKKYKQLPTEIDKARQYVVRRTRGDLFLTTQGLGEIRNFTTLVPFINALHIYRMVHSIVEASFPEWHRFAEEIRSRRVRLDCDVREELPEDDAAICIHRIHDDELRALCTFESSVSILVSRRMFSSSVQNPTRIRSVSGVDCSSLLEALVINVQHEFIHFLQALAGVRLEHNATFDVLGKNIFGFTDTLFVKCAVLVID
jgi:hypothetical protein